MGVQVWVLTCSPILANGSPLVKALLVHRTQDRTASGADSATRTATDRAHEAKARAKAKAQETRGKAHETKDHAKARAHHAKARAGERTHDAVTRTGAKAHRVSQDQAARTGYAMATAGFTAFLVTQSTPAMICEYEPPPEQSSTRTATSLTSLATP
jgi:hypothetical protein